MLNKEPVPSSKIRGSAVHGVSLCVLHEYRDLGLGKLLIEYGESLPFDYIWGEHHKDLKNLHFWLKRRKLLVKDKDVSVTYKKISHL